MKNLVYSTDEIQIFQTKEVPKNKKAIGSANMILNQIPTLIASNELSHAYKVVFPPGVTGKLMELKNGFNSGLQTTNIIDDSGKIIGQAGLKSLSSLATPMAIFALTSMITGQYFMAQINNSIIQLSQEIKNIEHQTNIIQESNVFSAYIFIREIKSSWGFILNSESYKVAIISNIIQSINNLTSSIYYFLSRLDSKMKDVAASFVKSNIPSKEIILQIERDITFLESAYQIRGLLRLFLSYLTMGFTKNNVDDIKHTLIEDEIFILNATIKQLESTLSDTCKKLVKGSKHELQDYAEELSKSINKIRYMSKEKYSDKIKTNIESTINQLTDMDEKGKTFFIANNTIYI